MVGMTKSAPVAVPSAAMASLICLVKPEAYNSSSSGIISNASNVEAVVIEMLNATDPRAK